nr:hypothetical protein [Tanacetum cinerariifolium]
MTSQRREQVAQKEQELLAQKQAAQEKEEPPQKSDFRQLIGEMFGIKASAEQKQKPEEMMLELLELCWEKEFYCVHDSIEDLIGMAMNTMPLSINLKSQRLDKEKKEVNNIVEQATKHAHNVIIDSLDMSYDKEQIDQNDDDNDLANERELLAFLIEKLKCEIDDSKNRNKFLETSNKVLIEKLKGEIEDFKNKNKSLESSNNRFKEANNNLSKINNLLYNDFKKSQAELARRNDVEYASRWKLIVQKLEEI